MATGQEGGTYLRLGHALADVAREDGFEIEVRSSSGSVENIHSLIEGKAQIALVQSDIAHRANHPDWGLSPWLPVSQPQGQGQPRPLGGRGPPFVDRVQESRGGVVASLSPLCAFISSWRGSSRLKKASFPEHQ
ncbi:MAG: hypothetical protein IH793_01845 [Acidobacteria bacterium]|nr:hypothetical protein [Acidobacteriota bacterium]